jgi:hypothetical protein
MKVLNPVECLEVLKEVISNKREIDKFSWEDDGFASFFTGNYRFEFETEERELILTNSAIKFKNTRREEILSSNFDFSDDDDPIASMTDEEAEDLENRLKL